MYLLLKIKITFRYFQTLPKSGGFYLELIPYLKILIITNQLNENTLLLLIITSCFISCETTINDTKNESKHIIGKEFNEDGEPLDIISGDVEFY